MHFVRAPGLALGSKGGSQAETGVETHGISGGEVCVFVCVS